MTHIRGATHGAVYVAATADLSKLLSVHGQLAVACLMRGSDLNQNRAVDAAVTTQLNAVTRCHRKTSKHASVPN